MSEIRELTRLEQLDYLISFLKEQKTQIEADIKDAENERTKILKFERKEENGKSIKKRTC